MTRPATVRPVSTRAQAWRGRRGFALVTALWAMAIVGALALQFHALARADRQVAANARAAVRARWAARAGLAHALEALDRALPAGALRPVGDTLLPPLRLEIEGIAVDGAVLDARGRLHVDLATEDELRALLEALELSPGAAARLAGALVAWRAPGEGARAPLREVEGVTPALHARLAPLLTVAGDGRVNVNAAAPPVLLTLPGMDAAGARAIVERRRREPYRSVFELLASLPRATRERMTARLAALHGRVAFTPREVEIVVRAAARSGAPRADLTATVRLDGAATRELLRSVER